MERRTLRPAPSAQHPLRVVHAVSTTSEPVGANPRGQFTVITGVSGSGKSTLAFDIVFNEDQRRYLESLNAYARSLVQPAGRPDVDAVYGIPPTLAIEQRLSPRRAQVHGGYHRKSGTFCTCSTSSWACSIACTTAHRCSRKRPTASWRSCSAARQHIGLLAPLVVGRKGRSIPNWPTGRAHAAIRICASMASFCPHKASAH